MSRLPLVALAAAALALTSCASPISRAAWEPAPVPTWVPGVWVQEGTERVAGSSSNLDANVIRRWRMQLEILPDGRYTLFNDGPAGQIMWWSTERGTYRAERAGDAAVRLRFLPDGSGGRRRAWTRMARYDQPDSLWFFGRRVE